MPIVFATHDSDPVEPTVTQSVSPTSPPTPDKGAIAVSNALRSLIRVALRLIASGALTAAVDHFAGGLTPVTSTAILAVWTAILTYAQVHVEDKTGHKILVTPPTSSAALKNLGGGSI